MAVAAADDSHCLRAVVAAAQAGVATPILVGDGDRVRRVAAEEALEIRDFELLETRDDADSAAVAVRLVHDGAADILMKGSLATRTLMQAVLAREFGLRSRGVLSNVAAFEAPGDRRLVLLTDCAVNIKPNFHRKMEILLNAVAAARRLGVVRPKVAVLAAVEKVTLPAMPATLDAEMLRRLGEAGRFGDCIVAGPMSLDAALDPERCAHKGGNAVAGRADILIAPNIDTANNLYKAITCIAGKEIASVVVGAREPLVVTSRVDTARSKLYSIALAVRLSQEPSA